MPRIVPANSQYILEAARMLQRGGVVAFPTETVYGLGALTFDGQAIEQVYELKGRPADNPLIAHVLDARQARELIEPGAWDERCDLLASRFWPGPLTLVLAKSPRVGSRATAGRSTIAVRAPRHPVARALIEAAQQPISAPSANRSGRISPTSAQHVFDEFRDVEPARDLMILDGGPCEVGIESTVLDLTTSPPRVLRPGSVTLESLRETLGDIEAADIRSQAHSPGTRESHYAPRTPTELVSSESLANVLSACAGRGIRCAALVLGATPVTAGQIRIVMPREADHYAHELYRRLREADALGADRIIVESPPATSQVWRAVLDRLQRAAAGRE